MAKAKTSPAEKASRIAHIVRLMATNRYRTRLTVRELAAKWNVAEKTVEGYANEASRAFKLSDEERAALRDRHAATFESWAHKAATMRSKISGLPDFRTAGELLEKHAKFCGVDLTANAPPSGALAMKVVADDVSPASEDAPSVPELDPSADDPT